MLIPSWLKKESYRWRPLAAGRRCRLAQRLLPRPGALRAAGRPGVRIGPDRPLIEIDRPRRELLRTCLRALRLEHRLQDAGQHRCVDHPASAGHRGTARGVGGPRLGDGRRATGQPVEADAGRGSDRRRLVQRRHAAILEVGAQNRFGKAAAAAESGHRFAADQRPQACRQ